jgi:flagellar motor switch protein FliG
MRGAVADQYELEAGEEYDESPPSAPVRRLTGAQKAAVFLLQMGKDRSAKVLQAMKDTEVEELLTEIARLEGVDASTVDTVLDDFRDLAAARRYFTQGGMSFAAEVLEASMGSGKARDLMDRLSASLVELPFEFLRRADPRQLLSFLQEEHPQTIALVLAYMHPEHAAMILGGLSEQLQSDVAVRVATLDRTAPEVIAMVESVLERRLSSVIQSADLSVAGGVQPLVDILNRSDRATERLILEGLETRNADLAEEVRSRMFVFEDITTLDDRSVQLVLREVDAKQLAVALKGVRDDVRTKILRNMSSRAATNLAEEIELLGAVRLKSVEEAQVDIVRVIRALEESGQIVINRGAGGDEYVL